MNILTSARSLSVGLMLSCAVILGSVSFVSAAETADVTAPTIANFSFVSPASVGVETTFSVDYVDDVGVASCTISGLHVTEFMPFSGSATLGSSSLSGTATFGYTFSTDGTYSVNAQCTDAAGNLSAPIETSLVVIDPDVDTEAPIIATLEATNVLIGTATDIHFSYEDNVGVALCGVAIFDTLEPESSITGVAVLSGPATVGTGSYSEVLDHAGEYVVSVTCADEQGNVSETSSATITVSNVEVEDVTAPTVSNLLPVTATVGNEVTLSVDYVDEVGVSSCLILIDAADATRMTDDFMALGSSGTAGTATFTQIFTEAGDYSVRVTCIDEAENTSEPLEGVLTVSSSSSESSSSSSSSSSEESSSTETTETTETTTTSSGSGDAGPAIPDPYAEKLVTIPCVTGEEQYNACGVVYYVDANSVRHTFINDDALATWYPEASEVQMLSSEQMAQLPLGKNIGYRPGSQLVKFASSTTVYVVDAQATLRPIGSEEVAMALYGESWQQSVAQISDTFYTNYAYSELVVDPSTFTMLAVDPTALTVEENI